MRRLPSLDGVRAVSIALVLLGHSLAFGSRRYVGDVANLGVRCFFVLSGFLITSLLLEEFRKNGQISLRNFYARRTLRIFPAFYVFLLGVFFLERSGVVERISTPSWIHAVTYTSDYLSLHDRPLGHLWSLAVEEQFYLIWPVAVVLLRPRKALWSAFAVVLIVPLVRFFTWRFFPDSAHEMKWQFHTVCDALATGCLLAGVRDAAWERPAYRRFLNSAAFALVPIGVLALNWITVGRPRVDYLVGQTSLNVGIALCIDYLVRKPDGFAGRTMNIRFVAYVGTLSYSIYLWQQIFANPDAPGLAYRVAFALAAAWCSFTFVEKPFLSLRQRFESARRPRLDRKVPAPSPAG